MGRKQGQCTKDESQGVPRKSTRVRGPPKDSFADDFVGDQWKTLRTLPGAKQRTESCVHEATPTHDSAPKSSIITYDPNRIAVEDYIDVIDVIKKDESANQNPHLLLMKWEELSTKYKKSLGDIKTYPREEVWFHHNQLKVIKGQIDKYKKLALSIESTGATAAVAEIIEDHKGDDYVETTASSSPTQHGAATLVGVEDAAIELTDHDVDGEGSVEVCKNLAFDPNSSEEEENEVLVRGSAAHAHGAATPLADGVDIRVERMDFSTLSPEKGGVINTSPSPHVQKEQTAIVGADTSHTNGNIALGMAVNPNTSHASIGGSGIVNLDGDISPTHAKVGKCNVKAALEPKVSTATCEPKAWVNFLKKPELENYSLTYKDLGEQKLKRKLRAPKSMVDSGSLRWQNTLVGSFLGKKITVFLC